MLLNGVTETFIIIGLSLLSLLLGTLLAISYLKSPKTTVNNLQEIKQMIWQWLFH
jgi:hypothetical protein